MRRIVRLGIRAYEGNEMCRERAGEVSEAYGYSAVSETIYLALFYLS